MTHIQARITLPSAGDVSTSPTRKKILEKIDDPNNVDFVSSNVNSFRDQAMLYIFEDNEEVIKMIIKGRSRTMRHVSRKPTELLFGCLKFGPQNPIQTH